MPETGRARAGTTTVVLIGAPVEVGAHYAGAAMGPAALRTAGLGTALARLGHTVVDRGDLAVAPAAASAFAAPDALPALRNADAVARWTAALAEAVATSLREGAVPLVLGGDHSLSLGSVSGVARHCRAAGRPLFVLWLDAHADFNTPATSPTGNVHGMTLAALCGEPGLDALLGPPGGPSLDPARVFLFGVRSVDEGERALVDARDVAIVDMRTIDEHGVVVPLRRILERVAAADGLLHVSFDVDFLDPALAPGVSTAVPGGATFREAHLVMEMLHDCGRVVSLDVVELNPFLDERGRSALAVVDLVASLFGRQVVGRRPDGRSGLA